MIKGNTLHQIYSYDNVLFCVSSTFEMLYRYKFDRNTNEVVESAAFERVRTGNPKLDFLKGLNSVNMMGRPTPLEHTRYDVCCLLSEKKTIEGYILYAKLPFRDKKINASERMYFVLKKYEKREGV